MSGDDISGIVTAVALAACLIYVLITAGRQYRVSGIGVVEVLFLLALLAVSTPLLAAYMAKVHGGGKAPSTGCARVGLAAPASRSAVAVQGCRREEQSRGRGKPDVPEKHAEQPHGARTVNTIEDTNVHGLVIQAGTIVGDINTDADGVRHTAEVLMVSVEGFRSSTTTVSYEGEGGETYRSVGGGVEVLVEGLTTQAVILRRMRPVIDARRPPRPVSGVGMIHSALEVRGFAVDLDAAEPVLSPMESGAPDFPFTVAKGDPELFAISPSSSKEVDWHLELDWTSAGRNGTVVVQWADGRPFLCTPAPTS